MLPVKKKKQHYESCTVNSFTPRAMTQKTCTGEKGKLIAPLVQSASGLEKSLSPSPYFPLHIFSCVSFFPDGRSEINTAVYRTFFRLLLRPSVEGCFFFLFLLWAIAESVNTRQTFCTRKGGRRREGRRKRKKPHLTYLLHFSHGRRLDGSVKKTCGDLPCVKGLVLSPYATFVCMRVTERERPRERERKLGVWRPCLQSHLAPAEVISPQQVVCHSLSHSYTMFALQKDATPAPPTDTRTRIHAQMCGVFFFFYTQSEKPSSGCHVVLGSCCFFLSCSVMSKT